MLIRGLVGDENILRDYFTREALLDRLSEGLSKSNRPVVFLVGSALSAPVAHGDHGVPNVAGVVDLIRNEFSGSVLSDLDKITGSAPNPYQEAFSFLLAHRGQNTVNDVIKSAVWKARARPTANFSSEYRPSSATDDDTCREFDADHSAWSLTPGTRALGALLAQKPETFGLFALTTNFDPLIEIAVRANGGNAYRTVLHRDGNIGQTEASGCHVVHLHGYWYGTDTLHTPRQITQERPRLKASLAHVLKSKTLVVIGYGGWDDVFTSTLLELLEDDKTNIEVIWTVYGGRDTINPALLRSLSSGIDRGLVTIYHNVDAHTFLPDLADRWNILREDPTVIQTQSDGERALELIVDLPKPSNHAGPNHTYFNEREQDRPPVVDYYVGRKSEAELLDQSDERVVFLTGIGGQGKSALAGNYLTRHRSDGKYEQIVWRDCKEESERFEEQIASMVYASYRGEVSIAEISSRPIDDLLRIFVSILSKQKTLIVFDNVDHYIDLETGRIVGSADKFIDILLASDARCRVIFTCRPSVDTSHRSVLSIKLKGIGLNDAEELFRMRSVQAPESDVKRAHSITDGHAFWLDLVAAQISRNADGPRLDELLSNMIQGDVGLPVATLRSIWDGLKEREQITLRALAEAVRPITVSQLSDYLQGHIKYNQISKATNYLRSLNLIVVKLHDGQTEHLELHPLIRVFVRKTFAPAEQKSIIDSIIKSYLAFFGIHRAELSKRARPQTVDRWIEAAELYTQSGDYSAAFATLDEVQRHVQSTGQISNFIRVADILIKSQKWTEDNIPKSFDSVISYFISAVSSMGRENQALELLEGYRETIPNKNARYINFCDLMCNHHWTNGDNFSAIRWGVEGVTLKAESGVDTTFDASHSLALAQRDSGAVDEALAYFLKGQKLSKVVEHGPPDIVLGGAYYGNIGRCLHLMGQIDNALTCYKKSGIAIEEEITQASLANQGYIRQWVGELAYAKSDPKLASACFSTALACWELIAPPKAEVLHRRLEGKDGFAGLEHMPSMSAEATFKAWLKLS